MFLIPLPAKNAAPPFENWIITGELISLAAWSTALIVELEVQLKAENILLNRIANKELVVKRRVDYQNDLPGKATLLSLQYSMSVRRFFPVTTPGGTIPFRPILSEEKTSK